MMKIRQYVQLLILIVDMNAVFAINRYFPGESCKIPYSPVKVNFPLLNDMLLSFQHTSGPTVTAMTQWS